jgi:EAL domain-containing protein (putative c-di-GMP-specific phosphodiesterase class I)
VLLGVHTRGDVLRMARMVRESLVDVPIPTPSGDIAAFLRCGVAICEPDDDLAALIARVSATTPRDHVPDVHADRLRAGPDRPDGPPTMAEFRVGMSRGEVRAYAQPVVDLGSGLVVGYQGLARWQHRRLGLLEAADFVGMIADTALATQVDLYVARETAAVLALTTRDTPLRLYAPVSRRLIEDVRTEQYLCEIAEAFSLSTNQIGLQVTRDLVEDWSPALHDALHSLRDTDVRLVLTGVEHAADAQDLDEYGFAELHLSPRLTSSAAQVVDARGTVSEIVRIAHERGLLVAACGINDERHRDVLVEAGCDIASGDLHGRPEPADTID